MIVPRSIIIWLAIQKLPVHVGWLLALAYLAPTITQKIDEYSKQGIKDFIIMGHSQGAAISFLTTSYLYYLQKDGKIPADIRFKTYCSAAPKQEIFITYMIMILLPETVGHLR
jgi:hypothetical protein